MGAIIIGFIVAIILDLFVFMGYMLTEDLFYSGWAEMAAKIVCAVLAVGFVIAGPLVACNIDRHLSRQYVETYTAEKQTIEASLQNDGISGFERVELVRQAADANKELAGYKYDCEQWYGFNLDKRILELEPIDLAGGGEE